MVTRNQYIGISLVVFSVVLISILTSVKISTDNEGQFLCELMDKSPDLDMSDCPAHKNNVSWLLLFAFAISFLICGIGIYFFFINRVKEEIKEFKEIDLSKLDDDEKRIRELLKKNNGSMYQSDLIKETNFSKVKITRVLDKLAMKNIVDRQRRGMTNIVILK